MAQSTADAGETSIDVVGQIGRLTKVVTGRTVRVRCNWAAAARLRRRESDADSDGGIRSPATSKSTVRGEYLRSQEWSQTTRICHPVRHRMSRRSSKPADAALGCVP